MKKRSGFTLIELILVMILTGILSSVIVPVIITAVNSLHYDQSRNNLVSQARLSLDRLALEFRLIPGGSAITLAQNGAFHFIDSADRTIEVVLEVDPAEGTRLRYTRRTGPLNFVTGILSSFVETFRFVYLNDDGREIADTTTADGRSDIRSIRLDASWRPGPASIYDIPYALSGEIMPPNLLDEGKLLP